MKKNYSRLLMSLAGLSLLTGCGYSFSFNYYYTDDATFETKKVDIYRKCEEKTVEGVKVNVPVVDKQIELRFYSETPNIPYISVKEYYKEFFSNNVRVERNNYQYLVSSFGSYLLFDIKDDILRANTLDGFSIHTESVEVNGRSFLNAVNTTSTTEVERVINLRTYNIDIHGDKDEVYVPISFLSIFSGGDWLYNVTYNGKAIYVIDRYGTLSNGISRSYRYYNYNNQYLETILDTDTPRSRDIVNYTYGQLCLEFDHFRGYTSQLMMGDNNLVTLGLNGLLEQYHPIIKQLLLSTNMKEFYYGYSVLMYGLSDGGHTVNLTSETEDIGAQAIDLSQYPNTYNMLEKALQIENVKSNYYIPFKKAKTAIFELEEGVNKYYKYDAASKTAFLGFNSFSFDAAAWDTFYKEGKSPDQAPVNTDTYAYIRSKFYQAKADGAENVVLDLTTNGGGNTAVLLGIVGLLNGAKATMTMNDTFAKTKQVGYFTIDINLDGKFDSLDVNEANKFDFNVGVLTSNYSFSCGNLLPSLLKEMGIKIIGERSGGGSCAITLNSTLEGTIMARSTFKCLSNNNGDNIDSGVPTDFTIALKQTEEGYDASDFFDIATIGEYLSSAYKEA